MADDAGGQPVEAVDVVDGRRHADDPQHGEQRRHVGRQRQQPGERDAEEQDADAGDRQDAAGEHRAGDLGRRRHLAEVVELADREDHERGRGRRRAGTVLAVEHRVEVGRAPGHDHPGEEPERGWRRRRGSAVGCGVDAPLVGRLHRADPERQPAEAAAWSTQRDERGGADDGRGTARGSPPPAAQSRSGRA